MRHKRKANVLVGIPYWLAPEVIQRQECTTKMDIWSLGVAIMEMAEGEPPYICCPPPRALFLISTNGMPGLQKPERWSPPLRQFVALCLEKDPQKRPDASELLQVGVRSLMMFILVTSSFI